MSAAITQPLPAPTEAFGQTGVRQYLGACTALACAVGVAVCLAMWVRSYSAIDMVDLFHEDSRTYVHSLNGRFIVARASGSADTSVSWSYNSRPLYRRAFRDSWQPSIWKTIGLEMRFVQGNRDGVYWLMRVRWPTAAALLLTWPAIHVFRQMRRSPTPVPAVQVATGYCGRCGRPTHSGMSRCGHCGRGLRTGPSAVA